MRKHRATSVAVVLAFFMVALFPVQAAEESSRGLFVRKQEVSVEAFCRELYEKNIMNPVLHGSLDAGAVFIEVIKKELVEVDPKLATIDEKKLAAEILLLRLEIFGLAWVHHFDERLAVAQSVFTKNYLNEKGRDDIWKGVEFYNQVIARSSTLKASDAKNPDYAFLTKVNKTTADQFDQYYKEGNDPTAIARALNRLFSKDAWKDDTTRQLLMFGLYDHLGFGPNCDKSQWPNAEAQFRLKGVILGLYNGASEAMDEIKIVNI